MDRLLSMRTFAKVVDEGSFAAAARRLSLNQAVVTRLVADLESHLGARLLNRTTRSLSLTDAGEQYLQRCRHILAEVDLAEETVSDGSARIGGRVRVAVPAYFGLAVMAPRGPRFRAQFPDIVLDVSLLDRPIDLVAEGFDLAIVPSSFSVPNSLVARPLGTKSIGLCASPSYLAAAGTPASPAQLAGHACIEYNLYPLREQWRLVHRDGEEVRISPEFVLQTNSLAFVQQALRAGMGIGPQVAYGLRLSSQEADLVPVLPDWTLGSFELNIVYPSREHLPRRVRAVIDFFIEERDAFAAGCGPAPAARGAAPYAG
jgi:DNA-binding transcriptional LysR family regulator